MASYFEVIFYALVGGLFSLIGGLFLLSKNRVSTQVTKFAPAFAAGALLGVVFFELIPESFELTAEGSGSRWVLIGLLSFFVLEHFLHWFHHHGKQDHEHVKSAAPLIIIGDTLHNFIDGLAIGTAFLVSPSAGIVTAIAIASHEIPQEIGDFGLLLKAGYARKKVLLINVLSSLATVIGAVLTFWLGSRMELPVGELLAITAGFFIYIAASDLMPTIHDEAKGRFAKLPILLVLLGVLIVGLAVDQAHEKIHQTEHGHETTHQTESRHDEH